MNKEPTKWQLDNFERAVVACQTSFLAGSVGYFASSFVALVILLLLPLHYMALAAVAAAALVFVISRTYLWRYPAVSRAVDKVIERNRHFYKLFAAVAVLTGALAGLVNLVQNVPHGSGQEIFAYLLMTVAIASCFFISKQLCMTPYLQVVGDGYGKVDSSYAITMLFVITFLFGGGLALTNTVDDGISSMFAKSSQHQIDRDLREQKMWQELDNYARQHGTIGQSDRADNVDKLEAERKGLNPSGRDSSIFATLFWLVVLVPGLFVLMARGWPLAIMRMHWFDVNEHHKAGTIAYSYLRAPDNGGKIDFHRPEEEGLRADLAKSLLAQNIEPSDRNVELAFKSGLDALKRNPDEATAFSELVEKAALRRGKNPTLAKLAIVSKPPSLFAQWASFLIMPLWLLTGLVSNRIIGATTTAMTRRETMKSQIDANASKNVVR